MSPKKRLSHSKSHQWNSTHPVAVVVEGGQRNTTLGHTVDEGVDGGLGVLGTDLKGDMAAVVDQYAIPIEVM